MSGEVTDNHKVVFMFEFVQKLNEISPNTKHFSPACIIRNLRWRIVIEKKSAEDDEFEYVDAKDTLAVKVQCEGESKMWCTYARIRLTLISRREGVENFSKDFENLFSSLTPEWGYSEFMEWDKVIDPNNGYVLDNTLKTQAYVVADIPVNTNLDVDRSLPEHHDDWLALFEKSLNDRIVGRIASEFVKMNNIMEKALKNEETSEKLLVAAINPISNVISTEIQALEKKLEKFCRTQIARVVGELRNLKQNEKIETEANGMETDDQCDRRADNESKKSCSGRDMNMKKVSTVEEETVPVSALKIMKELIIEQQRTSFGWVPSMYGARAAYYRSNEIHSFKPDAVCDSEDYRFRKDVLKPLAYEKSSDSDLSSKQQPEDLETDKSLEMNREGTNPIHANVQQQLQKKCEDVENHTDEISNHSSKPMGLQEKLAESPSQMEDELLFCGKNNDGGLEVHKVFNHQQLVDLVKKYKSYKLFNVNEF